MSFGEKKCVFCENDENTLFLIRGKHYYRCNQCGGIFLDRLQILDPEAERNRYVLHENTLDNGGYRTYLDEFIDAVLRFPSMQENYGTFFSVLDWGAGPEPSLVRLFSARGYAACGYDPYFSPVIPCTPESIDLITCLEVAEHFAFPRSDFVKASRYLKSGGYFAVRTGFLPEREDLSSFFASWWYREDPTHISFFTQKALIAAVAPAGLVLAGFASKDVAILKKL